MWSTNRDSFISSFQVCVSFNLSTLLYPEREFFVDCIKLGHVFLTHSVSSHLLIRYRLYVLNKITFVIIQVWLFCPLFCAQDDTQTTEPHQPGLYNFLMAALYIHNLSQPTFYQFEWSVKTLPPFMFLYPPLLITVLNIILYMHWELYLKHNLKN